MDVARRDSLTRHGPSDHQRTQTARTKEKGAAVLGRDAGTAARNSQILWIGGRQATTAAREPGPFVTFVLKRTVAKVDSIGFVVRRCTQCSAGYL